MKTSHLNVLILFYLTVGFARAFDCRSLVSEHTSGVLNWLGDVSFKVPVDTTEAEGWRMLLTFDKEFTGLGVWDAWVTERGDEKWALLKNRKSNAALTAGTEFNFRFRVNYGRDEHGRALKPRLTGVQFQGIELCK